MIPARTRKVAALLTCAIACALLPAPGSAASAAPRRAQPLSLTHQRHYTAVAICGAPAPGHGACQSLVVARRGGAAPRFHALRGSPAGAPSPASGELGYTPEELHAAYALPTETPAGATQTIAIVDAYNDPTAEEDLKAYDEEFKLPECTKANGCFEQTNEQGETGNPPFPKTTAELNEALESEALFEEAEEAQGWGLEISLDVETAHAICQSCKIALVEASDTSFESFATAEQTAASTLAATEVSNSWGGAECVKAIPVQCIGEAEAAAFEHPGVVIAASAGDDGYLNWQRGEPYANYPASLSHVVAVGGTRLAIQAGTSKWLGETVWNGNGAGGGGCSLQFAAPHWQEAVSGWSEVGCAGKRAVSDVSADADPFTGVAVRYSREEACFTKYGEGAEVVPDWCQIGGTSLASPLIAAVYALAGGSGGVSYPAATLYRNLLAQPAGLHDVTEGSNGVCKLKPSFDEETGLSSCSAAEEGKQCSGHFACLARPGYDGPSGVGTPNGIAAFVPGEGTGEEEEQPLVKSTPPAPSAQPSGTAASGGAPGTAHATILLTRLSLTLKALKALAQHRPALAAVAFSFFITQPAEVRVSLAKRVRAHRRARWVTVARSYSLDALGGFNATHLRGRRGLSHGTYRLTLAPAGGVARSIRFTLG